VKCPSCGYSDDPLKDSFTGELIKPGDAYDVFPNGQLQLVKNKVSTDPTPPLTLPPEPAPL
jgi:hypothetical protein